jgi:alcohol dehydrogenase (cytochrome c)
MKRLLSALAVLALAVPTVAQPAGSSPGATPAFTPVTWERLLNAANEPHNWLMYSGTLDSQRFSGLNQVNRDTVGDLELKWTYQIPQLDRSEAVPLVVDGVMFITEAPSNVVAVDAATGRQYWRYDHPLPDDLRICCGRNNRGVAILGEQLYMSTLDAHLVAIDARSGNLVWNREVADHRSGYSKTAAPLVIKDKVVTGIAGGEYGIRGFIDSYEATTGELDWRADTIPGPDHPDNQTWAGDSWRTGGSATWITGSYDPDLDLVYWGTGNPGPDWNGDVRMGDNLYSDAAMAINHDTGGLEWYFQFTPHDVHDWDAIQVPILADMDWGGKSRKVMMWANRNAFFYVIDRETGEFLLGTPFARQTWAEGLDSNGRPIRVPNTAPNADGVIVSPPVAGATNWFSPAYSPNTGLFYVQAYDGEDRYFQRDEEYSEGDQFTGGGFERPLPLDEYHSAVRAIEPTTGEIRWEYPLQPRSTGGMLATAGDLVFTGSIDGYFLALDAETGAELWHMNVGRLVHSAAITYAVDGEQYVAIAAGNVLFVFGLPK